MGAGASTKMPPPPGKPPGYGSAGSRYAAYDGASPGYGGGSPGYGGASPGFGFGAEGTTGGAYQDGSRAACALCSRADVPGWSACACASVRAPCALALTLSSALLSRRRRGWDGR